jgi:penicillin-binding protein 1B
MPAKKSVTDKQQTTEEHSSTAQPQRLRRMLRWCWRTLLKLLLILVFTLGIYGIYLDSKVTRKFEGQKWQVPIQVYGQVEQFKAGDAVNLKHLSKTLMLSGYLRVNQVKQPGQFALSSNRIIIFRRAFDFGQGTAAPQQLTLDVNQGRVTQLMQGKRVVKRLRIEPILLDRLVTEDKEDRVLISLETVPEKLLDTLLLVEDKKFYFHLGVSPLSILRALIANIKAGRTVQGGSTLTQQLVKNMFLTRAQNLSRKINEALMALILEYRYSKDQLLEAYINEVYLGQHFGNGIYGFGLAAKFYFGKSPAQLNDHQMALLIAQIKGPSYYDPWRYPKRAKQRRDLVLRLMFSSHLLSRINFEIAVSAPLEIRKNKRLLKQKFPAYLQLVKRELAEKLSNDEQQSGIRVFTGFSVLSQQRLEQTVTTELSQLEKSTKQTQLQAAMIMTDIDSGEIRALIGGRDARYAGFNRALDAKRAIGSLIKPIVYLAALERYEEFNFATVLDDKALALPIDAGEKWRPHNYDGKFRGQVSLIDGLVQSLNIPTVNLGMTLGLTNVANAVHALGYGEDIVTRPSILLGALDMSPMEINQLYLPIANQGYYHRAHAVTRIMSGQGETLWQYTAQRDQRISDNAAYLLDYALTRVTTQGTAKSLSWRLNSDHLAGKTGTTNDLRDSWFIGYDGRHLVTTWLGRDDNKPSKLTGSSGALVLFAKLMNRQGVQDKNRTMPEGIKMTEFELSSGNAVSSACDQTIRYPAITAGLKITTKCQQKQVDSRSWLERLLGR